ncbi:uncharacterized protein LOC144634662 isoform X2 [Oculina patagonica]
MLNCVALALFLVFLSDLMAAKVAAFPAPFTRVLTLKEPPIEGKDVVILQNLLLRSQFVESVEKTGVYDRKTSEAVASYQRGNGLSSNGIFNITTALLVLKQLMYDGYKDDGTILPGYKFKIHVPVYKDRTIETNATLYDSKNVVRYTFLARCHGATDSITGEAINQLTRNGNTPTGLVTFDLNSPEPDPKSFGPYPVVRAVKGLKGNAAIGRNENDTFLSDYRSGILLHTGEWDHWDPSKPMPNSHGCIHVHPRDMDKINNILVKELGVVIHKNPFGENPYPYTPQGLLSIDQID